MHVTFCINNAYVNHLIVTLYSLIINNQNSEIHIHILSSDITNESRQTISLLRSVNKNISIDYYSIDPKDFSNLSITMDYITRETYYRLILAEVLPDRIKRVLYLDADIIVNASLDSMFEYDLDDAYVAGVADIYLDSDDSHKALLNMDDATYVNAGVLMINLAKIRQDKVTPKLLKSAGNKRHKYQDQDAINTTFARSIITLPKKYNYQVKDTVHEQLPDEDMTILHYSGSLKPWNRDRPYDTFSSVYEDYRHRAFAFIHAHNKNIKFGLLKYSTDNIGDSIQGIAARRFLPKIDYYFERDNTDQTRTQPGETVKMILNGWWGDGPENWPPLDQNLSVLPISMYIEDRIQTEFRKPRSRLFLQYAGTVGARSVGTQDFLTDINIDNYLSGCLTLTLQKEPRVMKQDYILAVDVSDDVYECMLQQTNRKIIRMGVLRKITNSVDEQFKLAELYLFLYQSAHCVVTTRLHTMLPCLALETPVLFLNDIMGHDNVRFKGLADLVRNVTAQDYINDPQYFDINNPPENSPDYRIVRKKLEATCKQFTGFMSDKSYLSGSIDEFKMSPDLIQALVGGSSDLADLKEENDNLKVALQHKANHVEELAQELALLQDSHTLLLQSKKGNIIRSSAKRLKHKIYISNHKSD